MEPNLDLGQERVSLNPLIDASVDDTVWPLTGLHRGAPIEKNVEIPSPVAVQDPGESQPERAVTDYRKAVQTVLHVVATEDAVTQAAIALFKPDHRLEEFFGSRSFVGSNPGRGRRPDRRLGHMPAAVRTVPQESVYTVCQAKIISDVYTINLASFTGRSVMGAYRISAQLGRSRRQRG
ncbi:MULTISPECIES: hypothetical protein [unclassified Actinoplanes]|uniref:hypothetical protein n=1 Tax=unclassified Actinoplanes TaxID=2626549 RepID=UPI0012BACB45|nr:MULTISPECIES: hypothetical protein [unclassified Actinoplanes]